MRPPIATMRRDVPGSGASAATLVDAAFAHVDPSRGVQATIEDSIAGLWAWSLQSMRLYSTGRRSGEDETIEELQRRVESVLEAYLESALDAEATRLPVSADDLVELTIRRFDALAFGSCRRFARV